MGRSRADKAESHQRIVEIAARRLRERGLNGVSIADLMAEAGMTIGGFYKHFSTRDDLVVEAMIAACDETENSALMKQPTLKQSIQTYLSEAHRDDLAGGCPLSALVNDTARSTDRTRDIYAQCLEGYIALFGSQIQESSKNRNSMGLLIVSALIGALGLARAVSDARTSRYILKAVGAELVGLFPKK